MAIDERYLNFSSGPYGPALVIGAGDSADLIALKEHIVTILASPGLRFDLGTGWEARVSGVSKVLIRVGAREGLERAIIGASDIAVLTLPDEEWRQCLELIDGMIVEPEPAEAHPLYEKGGFSVKVCMGEPRLH